MPALNRVYGWRMSLNRYHTICVTVSISRNSFLDPGSSGSNFDKVAAISDKIATRASPEAYPFMERFKKVHDRKGVPYDALIEKARLDFVHEVQHWLRSRKKDLKVKHCLTLAIE